MPCLHVRSALRRAKGPVSRFAFVALQMILACFMIESYHPLHVINDMGSRVYNPFLPTCVEQPNIEKGPQQCLSLVKAASPSQQFSAAAAGVPQGVPPFPNHVAAAGPLREVSGAGVGAGVGARVVCVEKRRRTVEVAAPSRTLLNDDHRQRLKFLEGSQRRLAKRQRKLRSQVLMLCDGIGEWQDAVQQIDTRLQRIEEVVNGNLEPKTSTVSGCCCGSFSKRTSRRALGTMYGVGPAGAAGSSKSEDRVSFREQKYRARSQSRTRPPWRPAGSSCQALLNRLSSSSSIGSLQTARSDASLPRRHLTSPVAEESRPASAHSQTSSAKGSTQDTNPVPKVGPPAATATTASSMASITSSTSCFDAMKMPEVASRAVSHLCALCNSRTLKTTTRRPFFAGDPEVSVGSHKTLPSPSLNSLAEEETYTLPSTKLPAFPKSLQRLSSNFNLHPPTNTPMDSSKDQLPSCIIMRETGVNTDSETKSSRPSPKSRSAGRTTASRAVSPIFSWESPPSSDHSIASLPTDSDRPQSCEKEGDVRSSGSELLDDAVTRTVGKRPSLSDVNSEDDSSQRCPLSRALDVYADDLAAPRSLSSATVYRTASDTSVSLARLPDVPSATLAPANDAVSWWRDETASAKQREMLDARCAIKGDPWLDAAWRIQVENNHFQREECVAIASQAPAPPTSLHEATLRGDVASVRRLLQSGRSVDERDSRGDTALHVASENGNLEVIDALLQERADVNVAGGDDGHTPLHRAAVTGQPEVIDHLLGGGANVDARDRRGRTPLLLAVEKDNAEAARRLMAEGADVNKCGPHARTPLHCAAARGHARGVEVLLEVGGAVGCEVDGRDALGATALALAAEGGHGDAVRALLRKGADPSAEDRRGVTPLHRAALCGRGVRSEWGSGSLGAANETSCHPLSARDSAPWCDVARELVRGGAKVDARDSTGETPLLCAVCARSVEMVEILHRCGASLQLASAGGEWPLLRAVAQGGSFEMAAQLVKSGAVVDARGPGGETALLRAVAVGDCDVINLLLMRGACAETPDDKGETPLMRAACSGKLNVVSALVRGGASLDNPDKHGRTPLLAAASARNWDVARALIQEGATVDVDEDNDNDSDRESPLVLAARAGRGDVLSLMLGGGGSPRQRSPCERHQLLLQRCLSEAGAAEVVWAMLDAAPDHVLGAAGNRALRDAARDGRLDVLQALLDIGVPQECWRAGGKTALQFASERGHATCVRALLLAGVSPQSGAPPALHLAAANGHAHCLRVLLHDGAHADTRSDSSSRTALHYAASWGQTACVEELLHWGAQVNPKDKEGNTPLHLAVRGGHVDTVETLCSVGADITVVNERGDTALDLCKDEYLKEMLRFRPRAKRRAVEGRTRHAWNVEQKCAKPQSFRCQR